MPDDKAPDAAAAPAPKVGSFATYKSHDAYASPPRDREQLVLVTGVNEDGTVQGKALGFVDEGGVFQPGQLVAVDEPEHKPEQHPGKGK